MGSSKRQLFDAGQNEVARMAKALAHPARIAILEHLTKQDECINSTLVSELGLAQATISQHLTELKQAGLIRGKISGTSTCYCIDHEAWNRAQSLINKLFSQFNSDRERSCGPEDNCC